MRVYHFVGQQYGLEDIRLKRLKIATLLELNDPFELFGVNLADPALRSAFTLTKHELAKSCGLLCFSRHWNNPVQWSHYADRHRGLCLGFDVPDALLQRVSYTRKRVVVNTESIRDASQISKSGVEQFLFTKYAHWSYEEEVRCFVSLEDRDYARGFYFRSFDDDLRLEEVIVGAESPLSRSELLANLGDLAGAVQVLKARLAFRSFRVVRQRKASAWR